MSDFYNKEYYIDCDIKELHPDSRKIVILFHGLTSSLSEVKEISDKLKELKISHFGPKLPGHFGDFNELNELSKSDWLIFIKQIDSFISKNSELDFYIIGESFGSILALNLKEQTNIKKMYLLSPPFEIKKHNKLLFLLSFLPDFLFKYFPKKNKDLERIKDYQVNHCFYPFHSFRAVVVLKKLSRLVKKSSCKINFYITRKDHIVLNNISKLKDLFKNSTIKEYDCIHEMLISDQKDIIISDITNEIKNAC